MPYLATSLSGIDILDSEVILGQYFKFVTCQVEGDCYMLTLYGLTLQVSNICIIEL